MKYIKYNLKTLIPAQLVFAGMNAHSEQHVMSNNCEKSK